MPRFKLVINSETNTVLFAEACKSSADFLFGIMSLPMATVVGMVRKLGMTGSLGNLFESIENLDPMFLPPGQSKAALLKPTRSSAPLNVFLRFNDHDGDDSSDDEEDIDYTGEGEEEEEDDDEEGEVEEGEKVGNEEEKEDYSLEALFCKCPECKNSGYSVDKRAICPTCGSHMTSVMQFVPYVLGTGATNEVERMNKMSFYMVMDDLVVKPMSAVSTITLLKEFNVKDVTLLQERVVHLGIKEALMLLNSSLHSKKVLTEVFINNQAEVESLEVNETLNVSP